MSDRFLFLLLIGIAGPLLAADLHDPTRPPAALREAQPATRGAQPAKKASRPMQVSQIQLSPRGHTAVINGKRLGVGGRIGNARVVRIEPGRVLMRRGGRRIELPLVKDDVKQRIVFNKANRQ